MFDLYSILTFVGNSKHILEGRVTDGEYLFAGKVSKLMGQFIDDEVYLILNED